MKFKYSYRVRKVIFSLFYSLCGFAAFLLVIFAAETIAILTGYRTHFNFETIHFQIALLGAILQGTLYFFKTRKNLA